MAQARTPPTTPPATPPRTPPPRQLCTFCENARGDEGYFSSIYFSQHIDQLMNLVMYVKNHFHRLLVEEEDDVSMYAKIRKEALGLEGPFTAMEDASLRDFVKYSLHSVGLYDLSFPLLAHTWVYLVNRQDKRKVEPDKWLETSEKVRYRTMIIDLYKNETDRSRRLRPGDPVIERFFKVFIEWIETIPVAERIKAIKYIEASIASTNARGVERHLKTIEKTLKAHFDKLRPIPPDRDVVFEGMECTCDLIGAIEVEIENLRITDKPPEPQEPPAEEQPSTSSGKKGKKGKKDKSQCGCGKPVSYTVRKIRGRKR